MASLPQSSLEDAALDADFVRDSGAYLGLCAGAYYACARVEFEEGSRFFGLLCLVTAGSPAWALHSAAVRQTDRQVILNRRMICMLNSGTI